MNKHLISALVVLFGCGQQKTDRHEKAITIPTQKIAYTYYRTYDRRDGFEQEVVLVKEQKGDTVHLTYLDSLMGNYTKAELTVFNNTTACILLHGDTCRLLGILPLTKTSLFDSLRVYEYNLSGVVDEESYVVLDEANELNMIWCPPGGYIEVFDSHGKEEGYFTKLEKELMSFPEHLSENAYSYKCGRLQTQRK